MGQKIDEENGKIKTKNKHLDTLKFINEPEGDLEEINNTDLIKTKRFKESIKSKERKKDKNCKSQKKQISAFRAEVELRAIRPIKTIKHTPIAILKANSSVQ